MSKPLALFLVALAGFFWAGSGIAAQDLFAGSHKGALDLTNIRMITSGFIILVLSWFLGGVGTSLRVMKKMPFLWLTLAVYGVFGIFIMQYTYFLGIEAGGAAAATVIQYTCPAMVICYETLRYRRLPTCGEVLAVVFAVLGIFLLVTEGDVKRLAVPIACLLWSGLSGAFFAFASIYPRPLLKRLDPFFVLGAGMFVGGLCSCFFVGDLDWRPFFDSAIFFDFAYIVIFGTVAAFVLFNAGLIHLSAEEATITAAVEPGASVMLSSFLFGTSFGIMQTLGIFLVLVAILMPLWKKKNI